MSIEIDGHNPADDEAIDQVTNLSSHLCFEEGVNRYHAFTNGSMGAQYAAELIFSALREMGIIPEEGIDNDRFVEAVTEISNASTNTRLAQILTKN